MRYQLNPTTSLLADLEVIAFGAWVLAVVH